MPPLMAGVIQNPYGYIMNKVIFFLLLVMSSSINADQSKDWINYLENPRYEEYRLKKENFKDGYLSHDFSKIFKPKNKFLGFIEPDFRRLKIKFESIEKISGDEYQVVGTTVVKGNICNFTGMVTIQEVREYSELHFGVVEENRSEEIQSQGVVIATYEFLESKSQKYSGIFSGIMTAYWYMNAKGELKYDNIEYFSDNYKNNQYIGVWRMYGSNKVKIANWGEHRIPFAIGLDVGASEFGVHSKYINNGWEDYNF